MTHDPDRNSRFSRRAMMRGFAAAASFIPMRALAQDPTLRLLMEQSGQRDPAAFDAGANEAARGGTAPTLSPHTAQRTEAAIAQYEQLAGQGGWPFVPGSPGLRLGVRHASVPALRHRLALTGDLDARAGGGDVFDSYVDDGVRRFQARHGLVPDGMLSAQTLAALNVPAATRLQQLRINLVRLRTFGGELGARFVMCNLPAAQIEAVAHGAVASRHIAVVGKPDRPSPDIQSRIVEVNFNPFWTVPVSIVRRDLLPRLQQEPNYLAQNRIRIFDARGRELVPSQVDWYSDVARNYLFRQDPGDFNSLGSIRINFPSAHGVYMHDTPSKNVFGEELRFHSSGCVRVQNVRELVGWMLDETPGWSRGAIEQTIRSGARRDARLARPLPLYWVYVTAWAAPGGIVQFRDDIYGRDGVGPLPGMARG